MSVWGAIGGGVLDLVKGRRQNYFDRKTESRYRQYDREMANTAHYREMKDMYNSGLNPILSAKYGGAGGGSPGFGAAFTGTGNTDIQQAEQTNAGIDNLRADTDLKKSQTDLNSATTDKTRVDTVIPDIKGRNASWAEKFLKNVIDGYSNAYDVHSSIKDPDPAPKKPSPPKPLPKTTKSIREGF